ncbi:MAG: ATP synthase F1 subunit delta [Lachnospiraceae bacterium]|nr:ATP synthase F1 subunit delta [Lachnospiraceae bacterium]
MTKTAKIYGSGLYDLALEDNLSEQIMKELEEVRRVFWENPDYQSLLALPSIPKHERTKLIEDAFGSQVQRYLVNFLKILCERGIIMEFGGCCDEYTRRYRIDHNISEAIVYTASALTASQKEALQAKLEKTSGKTVILTEKVQPSLIAGIRVELDGKQLDGSIQGRLSGISRKLDELVV